VKQNKIILVKLGGSLITYKQDEHKINEYLLIVDRFRSGTASLEDLTTTISNLLNKSTLKEIFRTLNIHIKSNPTSKVVIIHGAGSIGHSLVLHLLKTETDLENVYPIIKLAVSIQNQLITGLGIQHGINAISISSHQIMLGYPTNKTSSSRMDATDLFTLETIIINTDSVPIFFGDVGLTQGTNEDILGEWKVFSGDLVPNALARSFKNLHIDKAIFLTRVEGKMTGIYSKDPTLDDSELITRIEVGSRTNRYFNSDNNEINFEKDTVVSKYDVTDAMEGKLRNLIDLAHQNIASWVIGFEEFDKALRGEAVGTRILSTKELKTNVIFLGRGDAFGSGGFKSASILVELQEKNILLDCGPHALQALKASGRETTEVDWIVITHFHGDHFGGIPYFLLESTFQHQRSKPLTIIGPPGIENVVNELFTALYKREAARESPFPIIYKEILPDQPFEESEIIIKAFFMNHTPEAQGYRLESKSTSIAYTGDTGWTENLIPLISDVQLAILECNFYQFQFETHLNWQEVLQVYKLAERTAIIHLGAEMVSELSTLVGKKGLVIPLEGQTIKI
jgi:ribonuclease BN (tRNA processing enzyme)/isopentenyl phosphate kinase